ncbi:Was Protein Family-like 2 [Manis pentadactyla]|nr:Was Protein Family-like 2 [Manis pentadactyla]
MVHGCASQCHTAPLLRPSLRIEDPSPRLLRSAARVKEFIFVAEGEDLGEEQPRPELGRDGDPTATAAAAAPRTSLRPGWGQSLTGRRCPFAHRRLEPGDRWVSSFLPPSLGLPPQSSVL